MALSHRQKRRRSDLRDRLLSLLFFGTVFFLPAALVAGVILAAFIPLNPRAIGEEFPAVAQEFSRSPKGCHLLQNKRGGVCQDFIAAPATEREVLIPSSLSKEDGPTLLRGLLSLPENLPEGETRPAVLLLGDRGPLERNAPSSGGAIHKFKRPFPVLKALAEELTSKGLITLRYDKRTCQDCYPEASEKTNFLHTLQDARDALKHLSSLPGVDPRRILVLGHGEGAHLAAHTLEGADGVEGVMMLSGHISPIQKVLMDHLGNMARMRGDRGDYVAVWTYGAQQETFQRCFDALEGPGYDPNTVCIGGDITQEALKAYQKLSEALPEKLRTLPVPLYLAQGSVDRDIDPGEFALAQKVLEGRDADLHYIAGMGHHLTSLEDTKKPELHTELRASIDRFLRSVRAPLRE